MADVSDRDEDKTIEKGKFREYLVRNHNTHVRVDPLTGWAIVVFLVFLAILNGDRPISVHP